MAISPLDITESWEVLFSKWNKMVMIWRKLSSGGGLPDTQSIVSSIEDPSLVGGASEAASLLGEELEAATGLVDAETAALEEATTAVGAHEEVMENHKQNPPIIYTKSQAYTKMLSLLDTKYRLANNLKLANKALGEATVWMEFKKTQYGTQAANNKVYNDAPYGIKLDKSDYKGKWKHKFGEFTLNKMVLFGRPTYKLKGTELGEDNYLFFDVDSWYIGEKEKWWNAGNVTVKVVDEARSPLDIKQPWKVRNTRWFGSQQWVKLSSVGGLPDNEQIVSRI